jgi:hypothetical protein
MRRLIEFNSGSWCTVVVSLRFTKLEITTTASHALKILGGQTIFPANDASVFDENGKPLGVVELALMQQNE